MSVENYSVSAAVLNVAILVVAPSWLHCFPDSNVQLHTFILTFEGFNVFESFLANKNPDIYLTHIH